MLRLPLFFPLQELLKNINDKKFGREMMKFHKSLSGIVIGMATQSVDGTSWDQPNLRHNQLSVYFSNCILVVPYRLRRLQKYLNCGEESKVKSLCTVFPGHSSRKRVGPYLLFEGRVRIT
jgi:hypothetical protein